MADALTKPVDGNKVVEHVKRIGGMLTEGMHELAPEVEDDGADEAEKWKRGDEGDGGDGWS